MSFHFPFFRLALGLALIALLPACIPLAIGGVAVTGVGAAQERGIAQGVEDNKIVLDFNRRLFAENSELFAAVSTEISEGRLLITGQVPSQDDRITIDRVAWATPGVREVDNEVTIGEGAGFGVSAADSLITTKLRGRIAADTEIRSQNYSIETVDGTVYLIGIAQDEAELDRVKRHARDIKGVRNVVSYVSIGRTKGSDPAPAANSTDPDAGDVPNATPGTNGEAEADRPAS